VEASSRPSSERQVPGRLALEVLERRRGVGPASAIVEGASDLIALCGLEDPSGFFIGGSFYGLHFRL